MKLFTSWKNYLRFLWFVAFLGLAVIIYGAVIVSIEAQENPASGLAIVGVYYFTVILFLYICFIGLNYLVRKKLAHRPRASKSFLVASWSTLLAIVVVGSVLLVIQAMASHHYETNIRPKLEKCYEQYLDGERSSPYDNCT
jgi:hypothetical protein